MEKERRRERKGRKEGQRRDNKRVNSSSCLPGTCHQVTLFQKFYLV
jgi:hypothetical protein